MFLPLSGKPLIRWSLEFLEKCAPIHAIIVAVPAGLKSSLEKKISSWGLKKVSAVVEGGKERTDSTKNAIRAIPGEARWVGIHDAARPFVTPALVRSVFEGARKTGCAILAVPSKDTVKLSDKAGSAVKKTIPRSRSWLAQTPQVFRADIAQKLHRGHRGASFTDDASIAESMGCSVTLIHGSYENIKITTPEDLVLAERILKKLKAA